MKKKMTGVIAVAMFGLSGLMHAQQAMDANQMKAADTTTQLNNVLGKIQEKLADIQYTDLLDKEKRAAVVQAIKDRVGNLDNVMKLVEKLSKEGFPALEGKLENVLDPLRDELVRLEANIKKGDFKAKFYEVAFKTLTNIIKNQIPKLVKLVKDNPELKKVISQYFVTRMQDTLEQTKRTIKSIKDTSGKGYKGLWRYLFGRK